MSLSRPDLILNPVNSAISTTAYSVSECMHTSAATDPTSGDHSSTPSNSHAQAYESRMARNGNDRNTAFVAWRAVSA